jgi:four helix bundle protein
MTVTSYRDLVVWQRAMDFVADCYRATARFPKTEVYGLSSQLQRAAVSVPSNIAEGQGRAHTREFLHHLSIARGSLCEAETQLQLAERLGYLLQPELQPLLASAAEIGRLLNGLMNALERKLPP